MQLKVITRQHVFRFDQRGQPIPKCTEPFISVEVHRRGDIVELYDQSAEHLALAFRYGEEDEEIVGLSDQAVDAIQNFLLIPGAWYLENPIPPDQDVDCTPAGTNEFTATPTAPVAISTPVPEAATATTADNAFFQPSPEQRTLLREIQVTAEVRRQLVPAPNAAWDRQVQRLLLSQQMFGIEDPEQAHALAEAKLNDLVTKAKAGGIPERVIQTNLELEGPSLEESEDDGEDEASFSS